MADDIISSYNIPSNGHAYKTAEAITNDCLSGFLITPEPRVAKEDNFIRPSSRAPE